MQIDGAVLVDGKEVTRIPPTGKMRTLVTDLYDGRVWNWGDITDFLAIMLAKEIPGLYPGVVVNIIDDQGNLTFTAGNYFRTKY